MMKTMCKLPRMSSIITSMFLAGMALVASGQPQSLGKRSIEKWEFRCGWFVNPTPANASLYDREREWIIGVQGGYQAKGDWPVFSPKQWIETNGHYGYGCACLRLRVNRATGEVIQIESSRPRPLSACRRDPKLKKWDFR